MLRTKRFKVALLAAVTILALTAGSALAADQIRLRSRLQDGSCQTELVATAECSPAEPAQTQAREQVGETGKAPEAERARTREQARNDGDCPDEPVCGSEDPLQAQVREQDRDRDGENEEAPGGVQTRTETQERSETCAGEQGSEPAGPGTPGEPDAPVQLQLRSGGPGAGKGGS